MAAFVVCTLVVCWRPTRLGRGLEFSWGGKSTAASCARGLVTLVAAMVWSYVWHWMCHAQPFCDMPFIRLHARLHHSTEPQCTESIVCEALTESLLMGGLALFFAVPQLWAWLDWRVAIFYGLCYATIHMRVMHVVGSPFHRAHHLNSATDIGPSIVDMALGTYTLPTVEDMRPQIFMILASGGAIAALAPYCEARILPCAMDLLRRIAGV